MKNLQFFENFKGNFAFFQILSNFWRKFGQKFIKIQKYAFVGGSGAEPPNLENFKKSYSQIQWKPMTTFAEIDCTFGSNVSKTIFDEYLPPGRQN